MATGPNPRNPDTPKDGESRVIRLGQVQIAPIQLKGALLILPWDRKTATTTSQGSVLFGDVGEAHGEGRAPTAMLLANSAKNPDDLIGVLSNHRTQDTANVDWRDQGQTAAVKMDKLMALRGTKVPRGTRMFIELYEDEDPHFGKVVGIKINSAQFLPINHLTEEEKEARARKKEEKARLKQQAKEMQQEQAAAELPDAEPTEEAAE